MTDRRRRFPLDFTVDHEPHGPQRIMPLTLSFRGSTHATGPLDITIYLARPTESEAEQLWAAHKAGRLHVVIEVGDD